jgi:RHS repeat-associated protein
VAQWFDYAPYGSVIASTNTWTTKAGRQYIGQFTDDSGLSYLNARYFNSDQGQFTSQDPIFLGSPTQQNLQDPQSLNSYSYSDDNPIVKKDPAGTGLADEFFDVLFPGFEDAVISGRAEQAPAFHEGFEDISNYPGPSDYPGARNGIDEITSFPKYVINGAGKSIKFLTVATGVAVSGLGEFAKAVVAIYNHSVNSQVSNSSVNVSNMTQVLITVNPSLFYAGTYSKQNQSSSASTNSNVSSGGSSGSGGYGSPGSTYTSYEPGNAHTACGKLCS